MNARENLGTYTPDGLVFDDKMPLDTKTVNVKAGQGVLARGTVVAYTAEAPDTAGAAWAGTAGQVADCVLCDDIDTGAEAGSDVVGHAYRTGHLARNKLVLGGSATELTAAAENQLRDAGIYLSNIAL